MSSELDLCMTRFAERWHLGPLAKDAAGCYRLEIDGRLQVALFQNGPHIFIEGLPGPLPDDDHQADERLMTWLEQHLGELQTAEEVLSLAPEGREIVLFRRLAAQGLSLEVLEEALAAFINRLDQWERRLLASPMPAPLATPYLIFP